MLIADLHRRERFNKLKMSFMNEKVWNTIECFVRWFHLPTHEYDEFVSSSSCMNDISHPTYVHS